MSTCGSSTCGLKEDAFGDALKLEPWGLLLQCSDRLEGGKKERTLGCSPEEDDGALNDPNPKAVTEAAMLGDECSPLPLPRYKGGKIGGGTGNKEGWCDGSLAFNEAAAMTAA